jgi:hypothetical protein
MSKLEQILIASHDNENYNFLSLRGGTYNIPVDIQDRFWKYYARAVKEGVQKSLVYVPDKTVDFWVPTFDMDIQTRCTDTISDERFCGLVTAVVESLCSVTNIHNGLIVYGLRRPQAKTRKDGTLQYGVHVIVHGVRISRHAAHAVRTHFMAMEYVEEWVNEFSANKEELIDTSVCPCGKNGLHLAPQQKPGSDQNYYCFCKFEIQKRHPVNIQQFEPEEGMQYVLEHIKRIYGFAFGCSYPTFGKVQDVVAKPSVNECGSNQFCLLSFLEATREHTPTYKEWLNILSFVASTDIDTKNAAQLMNKYWVPEDHDENRSTLDNLRHDSQQHVSKGSIVRYLGLYGCEYDIQKIFKVQTATGLYNDIELLTHECRTPEEVSFLFQNIVCYVYSRKLFTWKYCVVETDKNGNKRNRTETVISKDLPFTGNDAFYIDMMPTKIQISKALGGFGKRNVNFTKQCEDLIRRQQTMSSAAYRKNAASIMGDISNERVLSETIVRELHRERKFLRYAEIDFVPYLGNVNPLPPSVLNTFQPFHWESYVPTKEVDVRKTAIWRYLSVVFGWSEIENDRLNELLDRIAFKLQHLSVRSRRIHTIHATVQGIGKSAFYEFLVMLFSERYCCFHSSIEQYIPRFNAHLSSKLIHFCDDISGATKAQTKKIFPLVTAAKRSFEAKGQPVVIMRDHSELWITGNSSAG